VALVRVYCGLASAPPAATARSSASAWLTAAVVDDAGRLLDVCDISDDAVGYAELGALLSERSGGTAGVAVAADSAEHQITLLLAAAGRPLSIADEESLDDYAERFGDDDSPDEIQAATNERRAVGLARALQAGALAASVQGAPRELMALKPVLAAHAALSSEDRRRLVDLATTVDGVTAVLPLLGADVVAAAEDGHEAVEVRRHGALLATYEGAQARRVLPDEAVLDL